jgi:hypothetical protein
LWFELLDRLTKNINSMLFYYILSIFLARAFSIGSSILSTFVKTRSIFCSNFSFGNDLYVEEIRVERAFSCLLHSHIQRESTAWFRARERKRVALLREFVHTLRLIERELCVKIRKFCLIATIVLSLFFFFSLDCYALYVYARLRKRRK